MKVLFSALLFTMFTMPAFSQYWTRMSGPDAAISVQAVTVDPVSGTVFAGTPSGGGIFKSTNEGDSWRLCQGTLPPGANIVALRVGTGGKLFAGVAKLYSSTDNGQTWKEHSASPDNIQSILQASDGSIVLATGGSGVYKSTDDGVTWTTARAGLPFVSVVGLELYKRVASLAQSANGNLFAGVTDGNASEKGVYKSTNGGTSWTRIAGLRDNAPCYSVLASGATIYAGLQNNVFLSTDNGGTWTKGDSIPTSKALPITAMAVDNSGNLFASLGNNGTFKGSASGTGWASAGTDLNGINVLSLASTGTGALLASALDIWGIEGGVWKSTDGGNHWAQSNHGISNGSSMSLTVNGFGHIFQGLGRGYMNISRDGGSSFERQQLPITLSSTLYGGIAAIATRDSIVIAALGEGLFTSTNTGRTWIRTSTQGGLQTVVHAGGSTFLAGYHISGVGGGMVRSTDNGATWSAISGAGTVYSIKVLANGNILAGTYNNGISRSTDNGATWTNGIGTSVFGNVTIGSIIQLPNGTAYTHTLLSLNRSTDNGATWSAVSTGIFQQLRCLRMTSSGTILLGTPNGLYLSGDNAATWTNKVDGLTNYTLDQMAVASNGTVYVGSGAGLYKTTSPITTDVDDRGYRSPSGYVLGQNYPNPFNPSTQISFTLTHQSEVRMTVHNVLGEQVAELANGMHAAGTHSVDFHANDLASGVYYYRLSAKSAAGHHQVETRKMVLVR